MNILLHRRQRGQAFVELCVIMLLLVVLVWGSLELAKVISLTTRVSSVSREAGRMIYAENYDTNIMDDVFNVATNMIAPGNLQSNGKIIISLVQRVPGTYSNLTTTNNTNDVLIIYDRYYYPYASSSNMRSPASNAPNWATRLPATFSNASSKYIPFSNNEIPVAKESMKQYDKMSIVEVFHTNQILTPVNSWGLNIAPYLYDRSAF